MAGVARKKLQGVTVYNKKKAFKGYTLITPFWWQDEVYLIDMEGRVVQFWKLPLRPGDVAFLLDNGNLFYPARFDNNFWNEFIGGSGSDLLEVDWDNNIVWKYRDLYTHHTMCRLKNGNTMILRFVPMPLDISNKVKGGRPGTEADGKMMWTDGLHEITPEGEIVWKWLAYEHLDTELDCICPLESRFEWTHCNTVKEFDNGDILLSFRVTNTIVKIDRKTGEVKWRWGRGEVYHQHDPSILDNGNILLFDNGCHREDSYLSYSRVIEVDPSTNRIVWEYKDNPPTEFYSALCSSAQRLSNGNTLINECDFGRSFEVTREGELVWEYVSPFYTTIIGSAMMENSELGKNNMVHRSTRYAPDFPGFKGKDLNSDKWKMLNAVYGPKTFAKT